jgi:hypothetical protein
LQVELILIVDMTAALAKRIVMRPTGDLPWSQLLLLVATWVWDAACRALGRFFDEVILLQGWWWPELFLRSGKRA